MYFLVIHVFTVKKKLLQYFCVVYVSVFWVFFFLCFCMCNLYFFTTFLLRVTLSFIVHKVLSILSICCTLTCCSHSYKSHAAPSAHLCDKAAWKSSLQKKQIWRSKSLDILRIITLWQEAQKSGIPILPYPHKHSHRWEPTYFTELQQCVPANHKAGLKFSTSHVSSWCFFKRLHLCSFV